MPPALAFEPLGSRSTTQLSGRSARVVIVGGGLSGMAAAVALESAGYAVTLLESRRSLGGRAGSFQDPQTGEELDNCQHVLLGCCTNLLDFYRRLGSAHLIRQDRTIHFLDPRGRRHDLFGIAGLPAPLHLGPSMLRFSALTVPERVAVSRAMLAMLRLGKGGRLDLADMPFGEWLDRHGQPAALVEKFYDPVLVGALNEQSRRASAAYAIQVFQDSLLSHAEGYVVGVPACPLGRLYERLPIGDVRMGARVARLHFRRPGNPTDPLAAPSQLDAGSDSRQSRPNIASVTAVELQSGEVIEADAVILAVGHHAARRLVPADLAEGDDRFSRTTALEDVPILGVHMWFDRPVLALPHAALIAGPLQWLFRKNSVGQEIHGVISAAREWVGRSREECLAIFERQVRSVLPAARNARLIRGVVVVEKRATFSPLPGVDRFRPPQAPPPGGIDHLLLAGDYTRTGWPATMEGAVRAGYLAAEAVIAGIAPPRAGPSCFFVDDLPTQWPARLFQRG